MEISIPRSEMEAYWQAIQNRDRLSDGLFVYAVRSTRIYCRPSCTARKPKRDQVVFYPSPEQAARDGYRPCRRCQPLGKSAADLQVEMVTEICRMIEAHPQDKVTLAELGNQFHTSPYHLQKVFKRISGLTPRQYQQNCRFNALRKELYEGAPVLTAIQEAGFPSSSSVYENSTQELGMPPGEYARKGKNSMIAYTVVDSPLGKLLVAGTLQGVCSVKLGDDSGELVRILEDEFEEARLVEDNEDLRQWVAAILEYLDGKNPGLDLPLDVRGTLFQCQVWRALQQIPYGSTSSYSEVAQAIGKTKAVRAVAGACAANPTALVVPCHRVVRSDGGLGGYHWGIERKTGTAHLEKESKNG